MTTFVTLQQIDEAADSIRERISNRPRVGMILGSGLNSLADSVQNAKAISYGDLPNWPVSTVHGHAGQLVIGELEGQSVFVMQGRIHFYEGYSMSQITLPVRVMLRLGLEMMFVTNAAGGVNPDFVPGAKKIISDIHLSTFKVESNLTETELSCNIGGRKKVLFVLSFSITCCGFPIRRSF